MARDEEIEHLKDEIASVNESFAKLQQLMQRGAYATQDTPPEEQYESYWTNRGKNQADTDSVTTIYKQAIQQKRSSLSSEDFINTSDEFDVSPNNPDVILDLQNKFNTVTHGITGRPGEYREQEQPDCYDTERLGNEDRHSQDRRREPKGPTPQQQARRHADNLIREAEASKAGIMEVPGNAQISLDFQFIHSALVDADYQLVAAHVDEIT